MTNEDGKNGNLPSKDADIQELVKDITAILASHKKNEESLARRYRRYLRRYKRISFWLIMFGLLLTAINLSLATFGEDEYATFLRWVGVSGSLQTDAAKILFKITAIAAALIAAGLVALSKILRPEEVGQGALGAREIREQFLSSYYEFRSRYLETPFLSPKDQTVHLIALLQDLVKRDAEIRKEQVEMVARLEIRHGESSSL